MKRYKEVSRIDSTYSKMELPKDIQKKLNLPGSYYMYQPSNKRNSWPIYNAKGNETSWFYNIGTKEVFKLR